MRNKSVWERACGLTETVVEGVWFDDAADAIVVSARPVARARRRCGRCGRRSPGYDLGEGRRRWRALDLLELVELAWHDCYGEITPSEELVDDMLLLSDGNIDKLIDVARLVVTDWRDVKLAAAERRSRP